jgi:hypothetical protein
MTEKRTGSLFSAATPRALAFILEERLRGQREPHEIRACVDGAIAWLLHAQEVNPDGGVSVGYHVLRRSWGASYPETTGYIVSTLLRATKHGFADPAVIHPAATRMGRWLLSTQMATGAFRAGTMAFEPQHPAMFNTGQILGGLADLAVGGLDPDGAFHEGARRAAEWMIAEQDPDGAWRRGVSPMTTEPVHTYYVRAAWPLARAGRDLGLSGAVEAAVRNAEWVAALQDAEAWYPYMNFDIGTDPWTHTVAYTIQGMLEIGVMARREDLVGSAERAALRVRELQDPRTGALPGQLGPGYRPTGRWSSMTGNAQMAIVWFRLAQITGEQAWRQAAMNVNCFNRALQDLGHPDPGRAGGLRGSYPGHVGYGRFWYMNWTQKFHVDALMAETGVVID